MVFLLFGKFDCSTVKFDGTVAMTTVGNAGLGFHVVDENELVLHPRTAVVVINTP